MLMLHASASTYLGVNVTMYHYVRCAQQRVTCLSPLKIGQLGYENGGGSV